jgi:peroxiredoxin
VVAYLAAAVVLVSVLCVANLALTLALIRSMRHQSQARAASGFPELGLLPRGAKAPEFAATTVDGEARSLADLLGARSVVGFFSVRCPPCRVQLPKFADFARTFPGGPAQVLAVVTGDPALAGEFADALAGAASVVVEDRGGPVSTAFSLAASPVFYVLDERGYIQVGAPAVQMVASHAHELV